MAVEMRAHHAPATQVGRTPLVAGAREQLTFTPLEDSPVEASTQAAVQNDLVQVFLSQASPSDASESAAAQPDALLTTAAPLAANAQLFEMLQLSASEQPAAAEPQAEAVLPTMLQVDRALEAAPELVTMATAMPTQQFDGPPQGAVMQFVTDSGLGGGPQFMFEAPSAPAIEVPNIDVPSVDVPSVAAIVEEASNPMAVVGIVGIILAGGLGGALTIAQKTTQEVRDQAQIDMDKVRQVRSQASYPFASCQTVPSKAPAACKCVYGTDATECIYSVLENAALGDGHQSPLCAVHCMGTHGFCPEVVRRAGLGPCGCMFCGVGCHVLL